MVLGRKKKKRKTKKEKIMRILGIKRQEKGEKKIRDKITKKTYQKSEIKKERG